MKIIVAGHGIVGAAVTDTLRKKHQVVLVDPKYPDVSIKDHHDADGVVICVSTPSTPAGNCDASAVYEVLSNVPIFLPVLIKSTILPDVIQDLEKEFLEHSICHSPEFLREASAFADFNSQKSMIIGGEDPDCFWQDLFTSVLPQCKVYFNCTMVEASLAKYTVNSFLATKVAFFNNIYKICEKVGVEYDTVRHLVANDQRIGASHTLVPGPDQLKGFGGKCLPKDTTAFSQYADSIATPFDLLEEAITFNTKVRKNA